MPTRANQPRIGALTFEVKRAGNALQLTPVGPFRSRDGRPAECAAWNIDAAIAQRVIARAAARQTPFVIDYEHQTLYTEKNGQPAPAAGWFKGLEWRDGEGLFASDAEWTAKASAHIDAREYLYFSPVFSYHPQTGEVLQMLMGALTNNPGIDGMQEVVALAARFIDPPTEEVRMPELLKKLLAALGLAETATEQDALAAMTALKTKADQVVGLEGQIVALKAAAPDPAKYVSVATMQALQGEVASLSAKLNGQELDGVITAALTSGKLIPAQEPWARELGKTNMASLTAYLDKAVAVVPPNGQTGGKGPASEAGDGKLTTEELAVCKAMGLTHEAFLKTKAPAAA